MSIPEFNHNFVIPPFINGDPGFSSNHSPYKSNILEFCEKFSFSKERVEILKKFVDFRIEVNKLNTQGYQWVDGSFVEQKELSQKQPPKDIDIATFVLLHHKDSSEVNAIFPDFLNRKKLKEIYKVDHMLVALNGLNHFQIIEQTNFLSKLFSTSRTGVAKGIVRIELNTPELDLQAKEFLINLQT